MLALNTLLGRYPVTEALRQGAIASSQVRLQFADVARPATAFKRVVRDLEFDLAELALMTFLIAKAHDKPLVLLPAVVLARFQHPFIVYNAARGHLRPADLAGKRVGIRAYSVTTVAWLRGVLADDHGVDPDRVHWVAFEDAHVAEFLDPPNVERAPAGANPLEMLLNGDLDAAVLADAALPDPRLARLIPDTDAAAQRWHRRTGAIQINHMVTVRASLSRDQPDAVTEVYRMLRESRERALRDVAGAAPPAFGVSVNRRNLEVALEYAERQRLLPRRLTVDELFDDLTRTFE
ncbi:MAG: ABC transporter substrate-binding protein [Pseudomonadota bacterium]|nr:ABC transporter substrate-binding protein [Pseudomonadota bacterium]